MSAGGKVRGYIRYRMTDILSTVKGFGRRILVVLVVMVFFRSTVCFGAYEEYFNNLVGTGVQINGTLDVKDGKFQTAEWTTIEKNLSVTDLVTFELDDEATTALTQAFSCKMDLQIISYNSNNMPSTCLKTLVIAFDPAVGKTYQSRQAYKFSGGHHLVVSIQSVSCSFPGVPPPVFKLTAAIGISRIYKFNSSFIINPNHGDTASLFLEISWQRQQGAEEYDL